MTVYLVGFGGSKLADFFSGRPEHHDPIVYIVAKHVHDSFNKLRCAYQVHARPATYHELACVLQLEMKSSCSQRWYPWCVFGRVLVRPNMVLVNVKSVREIVFLPSYSFSLEAETDLFTFEALDPAYPDNVVEFLQGILGNVCRAYKLRDDRISRERRTRTPKDHWA